MEIPTTKMSPVQKKMQSYLARIAYWTRKGDNYEVNSNIYHIGRAMMAERSYMITNHGQTVMLDAARKID